ncbi:hypothetical protein GGI03_003207, partial [Coemansia sp. RSA 2337]
SFWLSLAATFRQSWQLFCLSTDCLHVLARAIIFLLVALPLWWRWQRPRLFCAMPRRGRC